MLELQPCLGVLVSSGWRPGLGDPTPIGWITVFAYFLVAFLCGTVASRCRRDEIPCWRRQYVFWCLLALFMVLLGINKQLDLQSLLTEIGRDLAKHQGWYGQRAIYQRQFIIGIAVAGLATLVVASLLLLGTWRQTGLALIGLVLLFGFILVRASSFHHVDHLLSEHIRGVRINWIFELGGIGWIGAAAISNLLSRTGQPAC